LKLTFTSDLHVDVTVPNAKLIDCLVSELLRIDPDVFIIAGDIAAGLESYARTLEKFSPLKCQKLVVAGNHDIWVESKRKLKHGFDSSTKYHDLLPEICREYDFVYLGLEAFRIGNIGFVGSLGWYDYSFRNMSLDDRISRSMYVKGQYEYSMWMDKKYAWWLHDGARKSYRLDHGRHCKSDETVTTEMADSLKKQLLALPQDEITRIVAVLHHLPFREMVRHTGKLPWDFFSAYMGSQRLGEVLLGDRRVTHVLCGHTHFNKDITVGQVRTLCSPVGYAHEWPSGDLEQIARDRLQTLELD
jgi:predicted phosphohydrolase